ncbi:ribonuclease inhibitor-like isoform X2 [Sardina pilchardus]
MLWKQVKSEEETEGDLHLEKYLDQGLKKMLPVVKESKRVWLNQCHLSEASCEKIASVLQMSTTLRELDMSNSKLDNKRLQKLCLGLMHPNCQLETLRLNQCHLSKASCDMIASVLQRSTTLKELDMSDNKLEDAGLQKLCVGLRDPKCQLQTLRLSNCGISDEGYVCLALALMLNPSCVKELDVSNNNPGESAQKLFSATLEDPHRKVEALQLNQCHLSKASCEIIASVLQRTTTLRELNMSDNNLEDEGLQDLCARQQKRGKRAGARAQLKANRPPIPTLFLANVRSLDNKMDLLRLRLSVSTEMKHCAVLCLTETWLNNNMPDSAFQIDGLQLFRADRDHRSGKTRGGGLCVYVNGGWCTNCVLVKSYCSEAIELMTVKCRPHYLPREFTAVFVNIVYIPPGANANANVALQELHDTISSLQTKHPEAFYVVAGDFNHVKLTDTLPSFYQHVTIPTRGDNTLDCVYTNIHGAYRAFPRPQLGLSDHVSLLLAPTYRPLLRRTRPTKKTVTVWPTDAASVLQDCFQCTDWQVFREAATNEGEVDLEEYTSSVLGYISKCTDDVTTTKTITCYPNQKPWLNAEVRGLLKARMLHSEQVRHPH